MPTRPITGPLTRSPSGGVTGVWAMGRLLSPPAGFDWAAPVSVIQSGTTYSTNFNAEEWKSAATTSLYVAPTGNDTTGNGTSGAPYRSIGKALQVAHAHADASLNIYVAAGEYTSTHCWAATVCDKNINVIAVGGNVVSTTRHTTPLTWTLGAAGTYSTTRASVLSVWDNAFANVDGVAQGLVKAATQAECEATAGSWFQSGTTLYVHTTDGRSPDANVVVLLNIQNLVFTVNKRWYVEGFVFEGAQTAPVATTSTNIGANGALIFNNCTARYAGPSSTGFAVVGVPLAIFNNCAAYGNANDGFSYTKGANGIDVKAVEIGSRAFNNGTLDGVNNDNGSSSHDNGRVLRVNCEYYKSSGPVVADVGTVQSWNLGCAAYDSTSSVANDSDAAWRAQNTAQMWLDGCSATGSTYSLVVDAGATIYTRSVSLSGPTAGTVTPY